MIFFIADCKVDYIFLLFDNFGKINRAIILTIVILEETKNFWNFWKTKIPLSQYISPFRPYI